jgi:hypothetical protein
LGIGVGKLAKKAFSRTAPLEPPVHELDLESRLLPGAEHLRRIMPLSRGLLLNPGVGK